MQTRHFSLSFPLILSAITAALTLPAFADLVVNESFEYGGGNIASSYGEWEDGSNNISYHGTGGPIWSGKNGFGLGSSQGHLNASVQAGLRGAGLDLGKALTGEIWVAALINSTIDAGGSGPEKSALLLAVGNAEAYSPSAFSGVAFGINGEGTLVTCNSGEPPAAESGVELPKTWALYLAKLTINAGGADAITLWVFEDSATFEETEVSLGAPKYTNDTVEFGDAIQDVWFGGRIANNSVHATGGLGALRISDTAGDAGLQEVLKGK